LALKGVAIYIHAAIYSLKKIAFYSTLPWFEKAAQRIISSS
jgi:hypothetical protein